MLPPRTAATMCLLLVLGLTGLWPAQVLGQTSFVHRATEKNVSGNTTLLEHPAAQDPSAILLVTPRADGPARVDRPVGVYFAAGRWAIFTEDRSPMPVGAAFNVEVLPAGANAFVARVPAGPISGNWVPIPHPALDKHPEATPLVTQYWESAAAVYNPHAIGVWYSEPHWTVFNQDHAAIPAGAAFHVVVGPATQIEAGSPAGSGTDSLLQATAIYGDSAVYCERPFALEFADGAWMLHAADGSALPKGSLFLIRRTETPSGVAKLAGPVVLPPKEAPPEKVAAGIHPKETPPAEAPMAVPPKELPPVKGPLVLHPKETPPPKGDLVFSPNVLPGTGQPPPCRTTTDCTAKNLICVGGRCVVPSGACIPGAAELPCYPDSRCMPTSSGGGWCSVMPEITAQAFQTGVERIALVSPAEGDRIPAGEQFQMRWAVTPSMRERSTMTMVAIMDAVPRVTHEANQIDNADHILWYWISPGHPDIGEARLADGYQGVSADGNPGPPWPAGRALDNGTYFWFVFVVRNGMVDGSSVIRPLHVGRSCSTAALEATHCRIQADCVMDVEWPELCDCIGEGEGRHCVRRCASDVDCCGGDQVCDMQNPPDRDSPTGRRRGICR